MYCITKAKPDFDAKSQPFSRLGYIENPSPGFRRWKVVLSHYILYNSDLRTLKQARRFNVSTSAPVRVLEGHAASVIAVFEIQVKLEMSAYLAQCTTSYEILYNG